MNDIDSRQDPRWSDLEDSMQKLVEDHVLDTLNKEIWAYFDHILSSLDEEDRRLIDEHFEGGSVEALAKDKNLHVDQAASRISKTKGKIIEGLQKQIKRPTLVKE